MDRTLEKRQSSSSNTEQKPNIPPLHRAMAQSLTAKMRLTGLFIATLALCALFSERAFANPYNLTKTITWDTTNGTTANELVGPRTGAYTYGVHAFAEDAHGGPLDHDTAGQIPFAGNLTHNLVPNGHTNGAGLNSTPHLKLVGANFNQAAALAAVGDTQTATTLPAGHSDSLANVAISTVRNGLGGNGRFTQTATVHVEGDAQLMNLPVHNPETAYAEAFSFGKVSLTGNIRSATIQNGAAPAVNLVVNNGPVQLQAGTATGNNVNPPGAVAARDPVVVEFFDVDEFGQQVSLGQQAVFDDFLAVSGNASIIWNPTEGLVLTTLDSSSTAAISFLTGSWVQNPFQGSASIGNDLFSVTGDLALPWNVSVVGGMTKAMLSASYLSSIFDFTLVASGLATPTHDDVNVVMTANQDGFASAYATPVPEPSTLLLFGPGIVLLGVKRVQRLASRIVQRSDLP
jgi:hypothetical protein